jgi:hypothetical protein
MSEYNWAPSHNNRNMYDRYRHYAERQQPADAKTAKADAPLEAQKHEELSFSDFVDVINPLQQIPIVGSIYRAISGDEISDAARVMGGTLYGGPIGTAVAVASVTLKNEQGVDMDRPVMAMLGKESTPDAAGDEGAIMLADADSKGAADAQTAFELADAEADETLQAVPTQAVSSRELEATETMPPSLDMADSPMDEAHATVQLVSAPVPSTKPDAPLQRMTLEADRPVAIRPAGSRGYSLDAYRQGPVVHEGHTRPGPPAAGIAAPHNRDIDVNPALVASLMMDANDLPTDIAQGGPEAPLPLDMDGLIPPMREAGSALSKQDAMKTVLETMHGLSSIKTLPPELASAPVPVAKPVSTSRAVFNDTLPGNV